MKQTKMEDIAKSLGISKGLVSKALRGKYGVSEHTRNRVFTEAEKLNYDLSKLRDQKNKSFVVIYISDKSFKKEVFWQPIIAGVESKLAQHKIKTSFCIFSKDGTLDEVKNEKVNCIGRIIIHHNYSFLFDAFAERKIPTVVIDPKFMSTGDCLEVKYSNRRSSFKLTEYLIKKGHRRIIYYGAPNFSNSFCERYEGFKDCIIKYKNLKVKSFDACFNNQNYSFSDKELLKDVIKTSKATAIQCSNDLIARSSYTAIKELGLRVGKDISVVGFDNEQEDIWISPKLTTIGLDRNEIGSIAAEFILDDSRLKNGQKYSEVSIKCKIIERESVCDLTKKS